MDKTLIADSSSIISLAVNCLSTLLEDLNLKIVIPKEVLDEIVSRPSNSKRYALESIRIKKLLSDNIISVEEPSQGLVEEILNYANSIYTIHGHKLPLIHRGEAEALALLKEKNKNTLLIDERTTRLMMEDAELLRKILCEQNNQEVSANIKQLQKLQQMFPNIKIIRSSEIAAIAFEEKLLAEKLGNNNLETFAAVLYALKFSGCAISWREIEEYLNLYR